MRRTVRACGRPQRVAYHARRVVWRCHGQLDDPRNDGRCAMSGAGTAASPWQLKTPPGTSAFEAYRDPSADPPALVVQVGKTQLRYHLRCIEDLHAMLASRGDWMMLGSADEQKP